MIAMEGLLKLLEAVGPRVVIFVIFALPVFFLFFLLLGR